MIYVDNGATTFPKPKIVTDKIMECSLGYAGNPGRSGHKLAMKMDLEIYETREKMCKLINGNEVLNVIFTFNATDSLNLAIKGVLEKGDHVVTTSMEHNSVLRPLNQLRKDGIIDLSIVYADNKGYIEPQKIFDAVTPNTKMIVTTHMSNVFGTIVDIKSIGEFCRDNNILYLVDAAQSIGVLDIDVQDMNINLLAFPGHKALFGPMGTGALYIKEGIKVKPLKQGGTGSYSHSIDQPELYPDSLESGTPNGVGIIALGKGIDFINQVGIENIRNHEISLKNHFIDLLKDNDDIILYGTLDDRQGAVVSLNVKNMDSSEVSYILSDEFDIYTRPGFHCAPLAHKSLGTDELGAIRFSFGYFNTIEEVEQCANALKNIIERNKK
ncbi:MAG: aminotransferase class V-fold PLP-dependent enzyme [Parvimonas sp.]|uniref:aminotransferase class V-fold PLP-dependent enzyme n=1 Tax=Parvimonas sp. TaxID=1944660 RepID=UPI001CB54188|nr:aminotransferase class V-fold PLP-dependent enzyme [Parvimonas sp.]MBF1294958.1 aminotransferase class V-fold PLP-dependent enzyme [Parvimonas sp.]MBF1300030.1 aminotransferase class V-fold PLP-dependent enzyme [Parvimonas sp.]